MLETCLDVPFKGNRDYLQSANIWDAIRPNLLDCGRDPTARLSLTFRQLIACIPVLYFPTKNRPAGGVAGADVVLTVEGGRETGYLLVSDKPISTRVRDYEETIRGRVALGETEARLVGQPTNMSAIEVVVAMTKFLHQSTVSPDVKWLATRLELPLGFCPASSSVLEIRLARKTDKLATISDVVVDGTVAGRVAFNPSAATKP